MKQHLIIVTIFLFSFTSLHAQETQNTLPEREFVKGRIVNSAGRFAAGFRVSMTPENIETISDEFGYFELDCSTTNEKMFIHNPYRPGNRWGYDITFAPGTKDTIYVFTIDWQIGGQIFNQEGNPIPDINVEVLGENKSTTTNRGGEYRLENVTKGTILKITDPKKRYASKEIKVDYAENGKLSETKLSQYIPPIFVSRKDTTGVLFITDQTPVLKETSVIPNPSEIQSFNRKRNEYTIKKVVNKERLSGFEMQYTSGFGISKVGRLPEIQKEYAQGETNGTELNWMGPETNHITAWGPNINMLNYNADAGIYPYDRNGSLVPRNMGDRTYANSYNSKDFFRTGTSFENQLNIHSAFIANSILSADFSQNKVNTPIPNSYREAYKGGISINKLKIKKFTSDFGFNGSTTQDKTINTGGSYARLLHAIYTTPPTFDNRNGLSKKDAIKTNQSWQLQDESMRSYAPNLVNNPYYIASQLQDKENIDNLLAYAKTKYQWRDLELEGIFSFNEQKSKRTIYDITENTFTRNAKLSNLNAALNFSYKLNSKINFKASYLFDKNDESFNYSILQEKDDLSRKSHQFSYTMTFNNHLIFIDLVNKHYFSNTANDYTNLFPGIGLNLQLDELYYRLFGKSSDLFREFRLFASASKSMGEAPLLYKNKAALTTNMHSSQFQQFYETKEITFNNLLNPEIYTNTEIGLRKSLLNNKLYLEVSYFHNTTSDFVTPHAHNLQSVVLENVGKVRNSGYLFTASYNFRSNYHNFFGTIDFNFNATRSKVLSVHNDDMIALAGFSNIQTAFAKNEPLGAIYGTSYQRDNNGQIVIGNDGFPLVNTQLKKIGDPTPDFRMTLSPYIRWKLLSLSMTMEYSHGGDRWNGTKAYLDYLGMSQETAEKRNIKGFVFDGVTQDGIPNTKPVDFHNPAANPNENRWKRYGVEGVGETYIEDASYFRLTEIALSYNLGQTIRPIKYNNSVIKSLEVGTRLNNLFLITAYKGVDPESNLFGYTTGKGLDLFNIPSSRSFSFYVNVRF